MDQNKLVKIKAYIASIKTLNKNKLYVNINPTLIINPFVSHFVKRYLFEESKKYSKIKLFIISLLRFYGKSIYVFITYVISYLLFNIFCQKRFSKKNTKNLLLIDIFFLVDYINQQGSFKDNYFKGLYEILDQEKIQYSFLVRLYNTQKNPFKLIKFFRIINQNHNDFIFEFEFLTFYDLIIILQFIILYPFQTLMLVQKEKTLIDNLFNQELLQDIAKTDFTSFTRFIFGQHIAKLNNISRIYSWSEFQGMERSFNYAIKTNNTSIKLYGLQFYINYETYFNTVIDDLDYHQKTAYDKILVNGVHYLKKRQFIDYKIGVSLRYKPLFSFDIKPILDHVTLLASYTLLDTLYMLECVKSLPKVMLKTHPALNISKLGKLNSNIQVVHNNIYELFKTSKIVISTASGTCLEAVACGLPVLVIASRTNLTANPLTNIGKGEIWDLLEVPNQLESKIQNLLKFYQDNPKRIKSIAKWYKSHCFINPTTENIIKNLEIKTLKQQQK